MLQTVFTGATVASDCIHLSTSRSAWDWLRSLHFASQDTYFIRPQRSGSRFTRRVGKRGRGQQKLARMPTSRFLSSRPQLERSGFGGDGENIDVADDGDVTFGTRPFNAERAHFVNGDIVNVDE